jgi:spoIIIJ-associated protein
MKSIKMKGKSVNEATEAACAVLGVGREAVSVRVLNEGKPAVLGILGGEEAEVEAVVKAAASEEARQALQDILDKMGFLAVAEVNDDEGDSVLLSVKGEDMGRIIGKEGAMLKALETVVGAMAWKLIGSRVRVNIDAGGYRDKRIKALERLAAEVVEEVEMSGEEKVLPYMEAADRRAIHMFLKDNPKVTSFSRGEGRDRRIVIAPRK